MGMGVILVMLVCVESLCLEMFRVFIQIATIIEGYPLFFRFKGLNFVVHYCAIVTENNAKNSIRIRSDSIEYTQRRRWLCVMFTDKSE